jgi:predicted porin
MKTKLLTLAAVFASAYAHADNVALYGIIDVGLTRYSDVRVATGGGAALTKMDTGVAQANRLGFKGSEDLGGGTTAFFTLENGFNADDGSMGQGGLLFGRQAFVGIGNAYGNLSLGRQYDFMVNLNAYSTGAASAAGLLAFGLHAYSQAGLALNDRIYAGDRTNNSLKYTSRPINGFTFGAMYGLGEVAGNSDAGRTVSARAGYDAGALSTGFSYTDIKDALGVNSVRMFGFGGKYTFGAWTPYALLTQVKNTGGTKPKATNYEVGANYLLSVPVVLSAGYQVQTRNNGVGNARQLTLVADYIFSKRTDVYAALARVRDTGFNAQATGGLGLPSSTGSQTVMRLAVRHLF